MFSHIRLFLSKTQLPYKLQTLTILFLSLPPPTLTLPVHSYLLITKLGY